MDIKKILCPIDFSKYSLRALDDAVDFAKKFGAKLILLHVVELLESYDIYGDSFIPNFYFEKFSDIKKQAEEQLKKVAQKYTDLEIQTIIKEGIPFEEILETEKEEKVDLVIMGSHGHTFSILAFLGSVSEKVVRKSKKPVLILRYDDIKNK